MTTPPTMKRTTVVNITVHTFDVYVGRAKHFHMVKGADGYFGNPVKLSGRKDDARRRIEAVRGFLHYFRHRMGLVWNATWAAAKIPSNDDDFKRAVNELRGKTLGCFCAPALCHADVYAAWLNEGPMGLAKFEERLKRLEAAS